MVKLTLDEIRKLPPLERIKFLKKLEEGRRKEIEEAEKIIERSELEIKNKRETEEEEEQKEKEKREIRALATPEENLEGIVDKNGAKEEEVKGVVYGAPLEEIKQIYQIATRDVYEGIKRIRNAASKRELTAEEEQRINSYDSVFSQINPVQAAYIRDEQTRITVLKAKEALEQIKKYESGNY